MKAIILAATLAIGATMPALADDILRVETSKSVHDAIDALEAAVGQAGATVFARVNHSGGAESIGAELAPSELLIFGNPKLGTPAMQADPLAGLYLPLKVLAYEDADGKVWLSYEDPSETLENLNVPKDAQYLKMMQGALAKLTAAAAG